MMPERASLLPSTGVPRLTQAIVTGVGVSPVRSQPGSDMKVVGGGLNSNQFVNIIQKGPGQLTVVSNLVHKGPSLPIHAPGVKGMPMQSVHQSQGPMLQMKQSMDQGRPLQQPPQMQPGKSPVPAQRQPQQGPPIPAQGQPLNTPNVPNYNPLPKKN